MRVLPSLCLPVPAWLPQSSSHVVTAAQTQPAHKHLWYLRSSKPIFPFLLKIPTLTQRTWSGALRGSQPWWLGCPLVPGCGASLASGISTEDFNSQLREENPCHDNGACSHFSTFLFLTGCFGKLTSKET